MNIDVDRLIHDAQAKWPDDKYTQAEMLSLYCETHLVKVGHIRIIDQHIRKVFKWKAIIDCPRFDTEQIEDMYGVHFGEYAKWILIYSNARRDYFAVCNLAGEYWRARIDKRTNTLIADRAKFQGTTHLEYVNKRFHYSKYLYGRPDDIAIPEHIIVSIAFGQMDDIPLSLLAISTVNHKNRDHYDNRPVNLEVVTDKENAVHRNVSNELLAYGFFKSIDCPHCLKYKEMNSEQKIRYLELLSEKFMESGEWINNEAMDEILAPKKWVGLGGDRYVKSDNWHSLLGSNVVSA